MNDARRELSELLMKLCIRFDQLVRSAQIYPDDHPALDGSLSAVQSMIADALAGADERRFGPTGSRFLVDGVGIPMNRATAGPMKGVREWLSARGVGGYCVTSEVEFPELIRAVRILDEAPERRLTGPESLNEALLAGGVTAISVTELRVTESTDDPALVPLRLYLQAVRAVQRLHTRGLSAALLVELRTLCADLWSLAETAPRQAWTLTQPRNMVPLALRHPVHNSLLSLLMCQQLQLSRDVAEAVALVAICADAGKRGLSQALLRLPTTLSPDARDHYDRHPFLAVSELLVLPDMDPALQRWLTVAFEQAQGDDGTGTPRIRGWGERHPASRLLGLVAAWDHHRVAAGPGVPPAEILSSFRGAQADRHPALLFAHLEFLVERHTAS